jgi:group I intron endonuclease
MIIYVATNKINGKKYVGQTIGKINKRKWHHIGDAMRRNSQRAFHRAIRKYGEANFDWEVIERCKTIEELNGKERFYIKKLNTFYRDPKCWGYNLTIGGDGACGFKHKNVRRGSDNPMYGRVVSEETRVRIREAKRGCVGHPHTQEAKNKISSAHKGKKLSEEHRKKLSLAKLGKPGRPHSDAERKAASVRMTGNKLSKETKEKLRICNLGRKASEETRAKMSKALKGKGVKPVRCIELNLDFESVTQAALYFDANPGAITRVANGTRKTFRGYGFCYIKTLRRDN